MSSTTQITTFADAYTDLMNRVREDTSVTATETLAKRYINIGLIDMHIGFGEKFPWAERRAVLRTQPYYSTGTVTISKGSTSLTGSGTAWNTNNDFSVANARTTGRMTIAGLPEVYGISSVDSDTAITLDNKFIGSDQSDASYVYFEDEYDLAADFLRPQDMQSFTDDASVGLIGRKDFRAWQSRNSTTGRPRFACIVDRGFSGNTTPIRRVRLWKAPDDVYLLPYTYVTSNLAVSSSGTEQAALSADTDEPIVPLQYRHAIVYWSLYNWYRDRKDDSRATAAKGEFTDLMLRVTGDTEIGQQRPRLQPRVSPYVRHARQPYSTAVTGRYSTGTWFDELADRRR
jgi:hypothetical protein